MQSRSEYGNEGNEEEEEEMHMPPAPPGVDWRRLCGFGWGAAVSKHLDASGLRALFSDAGILEAALAGKAALPGHSDRETSAVAAAAAGVSTAGAEGAAVGGDSGAALSRGAIATLEWLTQGTFAGVALPGSDLRTGSGDSTSSGSALAGTSNGGKTAGQAQLDAVSAAVLCGPRSLPGREPNPVSPAVALSQLEHS